MAKANVGQSPSAIGQMLAALGSQAQRQEDPARSEEKEKIFKGRSGACLHAGKHRKGKFSHIKNVLTFVEILYKYLTFYGGNTY